MQIDWKEIRWNEALEMFDQMVSHIKDPDQIYYLETSVMIISRRFADATWITPNN